MTISGERTEQLDIFCRVTGFTSDFPSFIDVELIRFFHGAIQLIDVIAWISWCSTIQNGLTIWYQPKQVVFENDCYDEYCFVAAVRDCNEDKIAQKCCYILQKNHFLLGWAQVQLEDVLHFHSPEFWSRFPIPDTRGCTGLTCRI